MHIAVTGATGLVGANLVTRLRAEGHSVTATRRKRSKTALLDGLGVTWVEAPLSDAEALTRAFDGADVVFHVAAGVTIRKRPEPWIVDANVTGTDRLLEAVRAAGVARLVHCSSTVCIGLSEDGTPCTEDTAWNLDQHGLSDAYNTTKLESERRVLAAAADGLDAVVVNPGFMFGPLDQRPSSGQLLLELLEGRLPAVSPGKNSFVDVRDVVAGMVAAADRGRTGERYILAGHNLTYADLLGRAGALAGVKVPSRILPQWLAQVGGWGGDLIEMVRSGDPPLNSPSIGYAYHPGFIFDSGKAERELGYTIRPIEEGLQACLDWFGEHGIWPKA
jgi:dihydroflavonol-4-reductase